jgi:hypothetical protein
VYGTVKAGLLTRRIKIQNGSAMIYIKMPTATTMRDLEKVRI